MNILFQTIYALIPLILVIVLCLKKDRYFQENEFWKYQKWKMTDISIIFIAMFVFQLFFSAIARKFLFSPIDISIYGSFIQLLFLFSCVFLIVFRRYKNDFNPLIFFRNEFLLNIGYGFLVFICYSFFIGTLIVLFNKQEVLANRTFSLLNPEAYQWSTFQMFVHIFSLIVLAPMVEEIFFRGILFEPFQRKIGYIGSICFTSLIWSFSHLHSNAFVSIFIIGIILCTIYRKTRSLMPGIVFHSLVNLSQLLLLNK